MCKVLLVICILGSIVLSVFGEESEDGRQENEKGELIKEFAEDNESIMMKKNDMKEMFKRIALKSVEKAMPKIIELLELDKDPVEDDEAIGVRFSLNPKKKKKVSKVLGKALVSSITDLAISKASEQMLQTERPV